MSFPNVARMRSLTAGLAVATALLTAACGGSDGSTGPSSNDASLRITNATDVSAFYVRVRACGTQSWGGDLLGADVLSGGETMTFDVGTGCQDVRLESNPDFAYVVEWTGVQFAAGALVTRTLNDWTE
jgi:hypothetical protein